MGTDRIIIAIREEANGNPTIAFPKVCGFFKENGAFATSSICDLFPERGEVFLHIEKCHGYLPDKGAYGIYTCEERNTDRNARWSVVHVGNDLCEVITLPTDVTSLMAISNWIENRFTGKLQPIFCGSNEVFLSAPSLGLVGPVELESTGYFKPSQAVKLFRNTSIHTIPNGPAFLLKPQLPIGASVKITKKEAAKTLIHRLWKLRTLKWLSRDNTRELAETLLAYKDLPGIDWVKDDLQMALANAGTLEAIKEDICNLLLQNPTIQNDIEAKWQIDHAAALKSAKSEAEQVDATSKGLKENIQASQGALRELAFKVDQKNIELKQIEGEIAQGRIKAEAMFRDELKQLAANPAHLAVLNSLLNPKDMSPSNSPHLSNRRVVAPSPSNSIQEALQKNFHDIGLTIESSKSLSYVIAAASMNGQPVSFLGNNADYLVEGAAVALSVTKYFILDTPAGLLQPYQWPDDLLKPGSVYVIKSINRSAIDIVLGNLKDTVLAQGNGVKGLGMSLFVTLQPFDRFSISQVPFIGPLIDEKFLDFRSSPPGAPGAYAPSSLIEFIPFDKDEVLSAFKSLEGISKELTGASLKYLCGVLGALTALGLNDSDAKGMLFKYWLLPRLDEGQVQIWLELCDSWICPDPILKAHYAKYASISNIPEE